MTTLATIIQDAYRETNLIPVGQSPSAAEQAEALRRLRVLVASVLGNEAGEPLEALMIGNDHVDAPLGFPAWVPVSTWWSPLDRRLVCNLTGETSINLSPTPLDGSRMGVQDLSGNFGTYPLTLVGNGRTIEGAFELVLNTADFNGEWFFRADLGDWRRVTPLNADDEMPYPIEFDDMFITMLAMRINPRNGVGLAGESKAALDRSREQFRARYHQVVPTIADPATLMLSRQSTPRSLWRPGAPYGPRWAFMSGWPW